MKKTIATETVTCGTVTAPQVENSAVNQTPVRVFMPGKNDPQEAEVRFYLAGDDLTKYMNIMNITPQDKNPVLYWHQVAMDAIKSQESAQKRAKQADQDRMRAERDLDHITSGLVERTADKRALIPLDMSRLIDMASIGSIDLGVNIRITHGKGTRGYGYEEDD